MHLHLHVLCIEMCGHFSLIRVSDMLKLACVVSASRNWSFENGRFFVQKKKTKNLMNEQEQYVIFDRRHAAVNNNSFRINEKMHFYFITIYYSGITRALARPIITSLQCNAMQFIRMYICARHSGIASMIACAVLFVSSPAHTHNECICTTRKY